MPYSTFKHLRCAGISTCVPSNIETNTAFNERFGATEVRKISAMTGVQSRHVSNGNILSSDLCVQAAQTLLAELGWLASSIDGLIFITHTPDYFLPSNASLVHKALGLNINCAALDVNLGCSGYPYGLWLASMMLTSGLKRVLVLHGDTPSLFTDDDDRTTKLIFGDAGSATALMHDPDSKESWHFTLFTDGSGCNDLIIPGGGFRNPQPEQSRDRYIYMNGQNLFNFTAQRVPELLQQTLDNSGLSLSAFDYFIFHQSNRFLIRHMASKMGIPAEKVPLVLMKYGNTSGCSIALTMTQGMPAPNTLIRNCLLGYGVGLSWASAVISLDEKICLLHHTFKEKEKRVSEIDAVT